MASCSSKIGYSSVKICFSDCLLFFLDSWELTCFAATCVYLGLECNGAVCAVGSEEGLWQIRALLGSCVHVYCGHGVLRW